MRKIFLIVFAMSGVLILTACNFAPVISGESSKLPANQGSGMVNVKNAKARVMDTEGPAQTNPAPEHKPSDPKGMLSNDSGKTYYLSLTGLKVHTAAPTTGPAEVAWDFFDYQGKQQYDKALLCLSGHAHHDTMIYDGLIGKKGTPYLKEVIGAQLVRWADITGIAPKEHEDEGAYQYRVIYMEVNLKLRGKLTKKETYMRNGVNCVAIHVIQKKKGDPWEIILETGTPWMEK